MRTTPQTAASQRATMSTQPNNDVGENMHFSQLRSTAAQLNNCIGKDKVLNEQWERPWETQRMRSQDKLFNYFYQPNMPGPTKQTHPL